ncbi:EAL domain-containing protein [Pigmentiphaga aceris]|uniref:EAL domain-containing protein n=1 Tax=Pigmentiphaga aceris TaxID=1940612 RepID=A0A5C0AX46_9BURK|nr:EAL domain-containing protein [Pigmentiphaga aceris]QEI05410.1 EAL domain-containing protein [Pigmentiphaga aceris]
MTPPPSFSAYSSELSELVATLFEAAVDGILVFDEKGLIQGLNQRASHIFGYASEDVIGSSILCLLAQIDAPDQTDDEAGLTVASTGFNLLPILTSRNLHGVRQDGRQFPMLITVSTHDMHGVRFHVAVCHDASEVGASSNAPGTSQGEPRHDLVARRNEVFCRFGTDFRLSFVNDAYCHFMAASREQLIGQDVFRGIGADDREKIVLNLRRLQGNGAHSRYVQQITLPTGERRWLEREDQLIENKDGAIVEYQSFGVDITERKLAEEHVHYLATHDVLTGCANRNLLGDRMQQAISDAKRHRATVVALFIDLDDFKLVNDRLGHRIGDDALTVIAQRLQNSLRDTDTLARVGGDEFVVVSELAGNAENASHIADRVLEAMAEPVEAGGELLSVGASIGISIYPDDASTPAELLHHADMAMYQAKSLGGRRFQFFTPAMQERATYSVNLAGRLRRAIDARQFELHYQPLFNLGSLKITGIEALLRWNDGSNGQVLPEHFLPFAIEHGLMASITRWVLRQACTDNRRLLDIGLLDVPVSVNMCSVLFQNGQFPRVLERVLADTALPSGNLELEITESIVMAESQAVAANLRAVKKMGVRLSLDDFGTGQSSLAQLRRVGFDRVKIDGSFTRTLPESGDSAAISVGILRMADAMGMQVVAEGIEKETQRNFLREHDCAIGQGYWYARPMPFDQLLLALK